MLKLNVFVFFFCACNSLLFSEIREIAEIEAYQLRLANGIEVLLKPLHNSENILLKAVAIGGFSSLPPSDRASGKLAAKIAWESGFGPWTAAEVANQLLQSSIELKIDSTPFLRSIEGSTPPSGLEKLFQLIEQIYCSPRFDKAVLPTLAKKLHDSIELSKNDSEILFEEMVRSINSDELATLQPITKDDLGHLDFSKAEKFYVEQFLSTSGLQFIIVGDFKVEKIAPLIDRYLGSIEPKEYNQKNRAPHKKTLKGIYKREIISPSLQDCFARLSFPLDLQLTEESWQHLEICSQMVETRLRRCFQKVLGSTQGIDVAYEFPYYPYKTPSWLTIQFRAPKHKVDRVIDLIQTEISSLSEKGPSDSEIEKVRRQHYYNDEFWLQHKRYWIEQLTNYYVWDLPLSAMVKDYENSPHYNANIVKTFIKQHLKTDQYTVVLAKPK